MKIVIFVSMQRETFEQYLEIKPHQLPLLVLDSEAAC